MSSRDKLLRALDPLLHRSDNVTAVSEGARVFEIRELRATRAGSLIKVDLTVDVPHAMTVLATSELEQEITQLLRDARREVSEVRVRFCPVEEDLS